jgi:hypothetical protein
VYSPHVCSQHSCQKWLCHEGFVIGAGPSARTLRRDGSVAIVKSGVLSSRASKLRVKEHQRGPAWADQSDIHARIAGGS